MKHKMSPFLNKIVRGTTKHSPAILTALGIAGAAAAIVSGIKATPKALELIQKEKEEQGLGKDEKLPVKEVVKTTWKYYIPCALSFVGSVTCILGATSISAKRQAAFASAYTISNTAFKEYREKVKEVVGEKKEREVRDRVAAAKIKKCEVPASDTQIINTGGTTLCFDALSGRYFRSDINTIKAAVNDLNMELSTGMDYCCLNDFYEEIGLPPTSLGEDLGWNVTTDGLISIDYSSQLSSTGEPCLVIDYEVAPRYDYSKYA